MYTGEYNRFGQSEPDFNTTSHVIKILVSVIGGPFEVQLTHINVFFTSIRHEFFQKDSKSRMAR